MHLKRRLRTPSLVALAVAIGSHGVLFVLLFYATKHIRAPTHGNSRSSEVVFLQERKEPERKQSAVASENLSSLPVVAPVPPEPSFRTEQRHTEAEEANTTTAPRVDWQLEAEGIAALKAPQLFEAMRKKCESPEGIPPPECRSRDHQFDWNPEPKKAGIAGGIPYVRVGERCIVALGFLGCAIGELPQPNGALFEHMRDPDRPRSSVPEP